MIIAINPYIKEYFEKVAKKIEFLPISIKTREFLYSEEDRIQLRNELGIQNDEIVIGFVGRFSEEKNLDMLLVAFAKALVSISNLKMVLVGSGLIETRLKNFVRTNGIAKNVIFCGVRYDIGRVLASFDIFVLPSLTEGLSTSLLEAMASGRAVICSNIEANQALVKHNINGLLVDPKNPVEMQNAIETLCLDKQLRFTLGQNAKITAACYDEETVLQNILKIYHTVQKLGND